MPARAVLAGALLAGALWCCAAGAGVARAGELVTVAIPAPHGEIASTWLSYSGAPRANVLLPTGYDPRKRYPLVVLLNGLGTNYDWFAENKMTAPFDHLNAIAVMPEGGSGWYTDWWNNGERGDPSWESYILDTVLPTIEAKYRILPQRRYHAIAGISMGGMGAPYLGGRLPGFFGTVASISGFVDPQWSSWLVDPAMWFTAEGPFKGDPDWDAVEGPPSGFYFTGHNPTALAVNLQDTRVFVSTGTGAPSSAAGFDGVYNLAEGEIIYPMNQRYVPALRAAGVDVTYRVAPGGHDVPDWLNALKALVSWGLFKPVVTDPSSWTNLTVMDSGQLWNVGYRFAKPPDALVRFHMSGGSLFVSAAGSAVTLTTTGGCTFTTPTPSIVQIPTGSCRP